MDRESMPPRGAGFPVSFLCRILWASLTWEHTMRRSFMAVLFILGLGMVGCSEDDPTTPQSRRTLRVPSQFEKIQEAIDAAAPGDLVLVAAGTYADSVYAENLLGIPMVVCVDLKSGVEVRGDSGLSNDVVLVGNPNNPVVNCVEVDGGATLANVTVTGGKSGIMGARSVIKLENCVIRNNNNESQFGAGAGLYFDFSSVTATNCIITGNRATTGGGAVFANESRPVLTNCLFTENTAWSSPNQPGTGGALVISNDSNGVLTNCLFSSNHADSLGGAVEIYLGEVQMVNCNFTNNDTDGLGGAFYFSYGAQVVMTNVLVENNHSDQKGGGFYFRNSSSLIASESRILGNSAPEGPDGYIEGPYDPAVVILSCTEAEPSRWVGTITLDNEGCE